VKIPAKLKEEIIDDSANKSNYQLDLINEYFEETLDDFNKLKKLLEIIKQINRCQKKDEIYNLTIKATKEIFNFNICTLYIIEKEQLVIKATSTCKTAVDFWDWSIETDMAGKAYKAGDVYLIDDLMKLSESKLFYNKYRSVINVPIGTIGVFQMISTEVNAFTEEDIEKAEVLFAYVSKVLQLIKSEEKIKYLHFHDSLTGLYNRAYFEDALHRLDTKRQLPLSILIGDVNGLKLANDAFGHQVGDNLLKKVAKTLKSTCRKEDIISRWGGDEFAIILPETDAKDASRVIKRINEAFNNIEEEIIKPDIALGVATKEDINEDIMEVLTEAENRMYRNKLNRSEDIKNKIISSLQRELWKKDYETKEHIESLEVLGLKIGKKLNLADDEIDKLLLFVRLHDIGKVTIDEEVLNKQGELSKQDRKVIERHPEAGYHIAKAIPDKAYIADLILAHHEWWDGSGYPLGIKGEAIPFLARVLAIIDAYDVMLRGRPYQPKVTKEKALIELKRCAGIQFDPKLVQVFIEMIND